VSCEDEIALAVVGGFFLLPIMLGIMAFWILVVEPEIAFQWRRLRRRIALPSPQSRDPFSLAAFRYRSREVSHGSV